MSAASYSEAKQARRWSGSPRAFLICYITFAFMCRVLLRSPCADGYHWALIMVLEDSMSVMSFAMGLLLLHWSNGSPLSFLTKCIAAPCEEDGQLSTDQEGLRQALAENTDALDADLVGTRQMRQRIKLFAFAM